MNTKQPASDGMNLLQMSHNHQVAVDSCYQATKGRNDPGGGEPSLVCVVHLFSATGRLRIFLESFRDQPQEHQTQGSSGLEKAQEFVMTTSSYKPLPPTLRDGLSFASGTQQQNLGTLFLINNIKTFPLQL